MAYQQGRVTAQPNTNRTGYSVTTTPHSEVVNPPASQITKDWSSVTPSQAPADRSSVIGGDNRGRDPQNPTANPAGLPAPDTSWEKTTGPYRTNPGGYGSGGTYGGPYTDQD